MRLFFFVASTAKKTRSLPRNLSSALTHAAEVEEVESHVTAPRYWSKGRGKEDRKSKQREGGKKSRPLQLPISVSQQQLSSMSHDRMVGVAKGRHKNSQCLPIVLSNQIGAVSPHSPRSHTITAPRHTHDENRLPILNNMQAVAMVAVDTEQERLKVHNFRESSPKKPRPLLTKKAGMNRSKSMQPVK